MMRSPRSAPSAPPAPSGPDGASLHQLARPPAAGRGPGCRVSAFLHRRSPARRLAGDHRGRAGRKPVPGEVVASARPSDVAPPGLTLLLPEDNPVVVDRLMRQRGSHRGGHLAAGRSPGPGHRLDRARPRPQPRARDRGLSACRIPRRAPSGSRLSGARTRHWIWRRRNWTWRLWIERRAISYWRSGLGAPANGPQAVRRPPSGGPKPNEWLRADGS